MSPAAIYWQCHETILQRDGQPVQSTHRQEFLFCTDVHTWTVHIVRSYRLHLTYGIRCAHLLVILAKSISRQWTDICLNYNFIVNDIHIIQACVQFQLNFLDRFSASCTHFHHFVVSRCRPAARIYQRNKIHALNRQVQTNTIQGSSHLGQKYLRRESNGKYTEDIPAGENIDENNIGNATLSQTFFKTNFCQCWTLSGCACT